jgi:hypothetical protein
VVIKKTAEQRLRETNPDLMDYLERLLAPVRAGLKKIIEETASGPDLLDLQATRINPPFYIHQQAFERTPAFKQFHKKTGGDLWDLFDTPEDELDPVLLASLQAMVDAFPDSPLPSVISVIPPYFHKGRYLYVRIDLSKSKETLRNNFESILQTHHKWVDHRRTPRGEKWPDSKEEINRIFHAYDLVERHKGNYLKATHELYPETNGKYPYNDCETDRHMQQVKRWHQKVERFIAALQRP